MASKGELKVGIVGGGGIGRHYMGLFKKVSGARAVAVSDVSDDALAKCKELDAGVACFRDYREMIRHGGLDAIAVCTPNKLHKQPTLDALAAGLPVIVEKPMAMNAREAEEMCRAAEKAKKLLMIGFQWRFHPTAQMIRKAVDAGEFGRILYVRCQALRRRGIPSWGVFGNKELQGGGPMIDIGVHILEMAHYMMGRPKPVAATGSCYTYLGNKPCNAMTHWGPWDHKTYTVEDLAVGMLKFADGATLVIESSFAAHIEKDVWQVAVMGEKRGAQFDPPMLFCDDLGYMFNLTPAFTGTPNTFEFKLQHFVNCVTKNEKCDAPGTDGLMVQKMLDGIYRSAETGKQTMIR